jgi:hypothetical protein
LKFFIGRLSYLNPHDGFPHGDVRKHILTDKGIHFRYPPLYTNEPNDSLNIESASGLMLHGAS